MTPVPPSECFYAAFAEALQEARAEARRRREWEEATIELRISTMPRELRELVT